MKPNITMFFPAYNEEGNIKKLVTDAQKVLKHIAIEPELPGADSRLYDYAGHAILRGEKEEVPLWSFFDCGPFGTDHQHCDPRSAGSHHSRRHGLWSVCRHPCRECPQARTIRRMNHE